MALLRVTIADEVVRRMAAMAAADNRKESNMAEVLLIEAMDARDRAAKAKAA